MTVDEEMAALIQAAKAAAPHELCGLMFDGVGFHALPNVHPEPEHHFKIAHEDYLKASMRYDSKPLAIVHSHPMRGAGLSASDCRLMDALQKADQPIFMVVVGLHPEEVRIFRKVDSRYHLEFVWPDEKE